MSADFKTAGAQLAGEVLTGLKFDLLEQLQTWLENAGLDVPELQSTEYFELTEAFGETMREALAGGLAIADAIAKHEN